MSAAQEFARRIFSRSVLKQEKYRQITALLGETEGLACLDIGGDNGVISFLLRERGGTWTSVDLEAETVESIRELVGERVERIDGSRLPFPDASFDGIVIIDFLEHIHGDHEFAAELRRVLRPDGFLIANVPHLKPRSLILRLRDALGLTDAWHGHVRPGYDRDTLGRTLAPHFTIRRVRTYSKAFSELLDTVLTWAFESLKKGRGPSGKGTVVTSADLGRHRAKFRLLGAAYPFFWLFSRLDYLMFMQEGYKMIAKAVPSHPSGTAEGRP